MKRLMIALTIVVASLGISRPSQAGIGIATNTMWISIMGAALSIRIAGVAYDHIGLTSDQKVNVGWGIFMGLVVLDNETATVSFSKLSDEKGASLGMNDKEIASFNAEVLSVNSVLDEANATESVEESAEVWLKAQEELAPETMSAISKIVAAMRAQLQ